MACVRERAFVFNKSWRIILFLRCNRRLQLLLPRNSFRSWNAVDWRHEYWLRTAKSNHIYVERWEWKSTGVCRSLDNFHFISIFCVITERERLMMLAEWKTVVRFITHSHSHKHSCCVVVYYSNWRERFSCTERGISWKKSHGCDICAGYRSPVCLPGKHNCNSYLLKMCNYQRDGTITFHVSKGQPRKGGKDKEDLGTFGYGLLRIGDNERTVPI